MARRFLGQPVQYDESCKPSGIRLERAYVRTTPRGNFVVARASMGAAGV